MKPNFSKRSTTAHAKFFRHNPLFYQHPVPEVYPLFSYESVRTRAVDTWRADLRHQQGLSVPPPPVMLEPEFLEHGIFNQRQLEQQRLELLLCESPGYQLQYGQQLHDRLGLNHGILKTYATNHRTEKFFNCILVSSEFFYTWLGRKPTQYFIDGPEWLALRQMIHAQGLEIPPEYDNPIPRTGLLCGESFWEAVANIHTGRVFYPLDQLNEEGAGAGPAPGGAGGGGPSGPSPALSLGGGAAAAIANPGMVLSAVQIATFKNAAKQGLAFVEVCR